MLDAKRVLVVDDERDIREGVSQWLEADGFATYQAEDGDVAIRVAQEHSPDAILLDVLMPRKGGLETLTELRADVQTSDIPVVMLSASLRDERLALDSGATFFVQKPYDPRKLVAALRVATDHTLTT